MSDIDRRDLLKAGALVSLATACSPDRAPRPPAEEPPLEPTVVRIASVKTAVEGGILPALIDRFSQRAGMTVRLTTGTAVYDLARDGKVDLVISHYGHSDAEGFVLEGLGEWPRMIFSNQMALFGPPSDPAGVRGLDDLAEAFHRIATTQSPYVLNDQNGVRYLTEILWNAIGKPERAAWWIDPKVGKDAAIVQASERGAYALWGLTPFLRLGAYRSLALEPLVVADPLLQRMMCSIVVKPGAGRRVNTPGALAFQSYLLAPETQAAIRTVHYPGKQHVSWLPAGRHNRAEALPKV